MTQQLIVAAVALGLVASMLVYPFAFGPLRETLGVRGIALAGLLLCAGSLWLGRRFRGEERAAWLALGAPLLLALAGVLDSVEPLELIPPWIQLCVGLYFIETLKQGEGLMLEVVRWLVPEAPDFVGPYCRKLTALWGGFFIVSAVLGACVALWGSHEAWRFVSGPGVCAVMAVVTIAEFIVRKTWFRYYFHGGPFDRVWSRLFPAEATAEGRRSLEAIRRYHESRGGPGA